MSKPMRATAWGACIGIVTCAAVAAITAKAAWNVMNDPPGVTRPCVFCSPYVNYKSPPLPEPMR